MLYPIELLRHKLPARICGAMDGVHVNGQAWLCHVVLRHFKCRHTPRRIAKFAEEAKKDPLTLLSPRQLKDATSDKSVRHPS